MFRTFWPCLPLGNLAPEAMKRSTSVHSFPKKKYYNVFRLTTLQPSDLLRFITTQLLRCFFLRVLRFSFLHKKNKTNKHILIPIRSEIKGLQVFEFAASCRTLLVLFVTRGVNLTKIVQQTYRQNNSNQLSRVADPSMFYSKRNNSFGSL